MVHYTNIKMYVALRKVFAQTVLISKWKFGVSPVLHLAVEDLNLLWRIGCFYCFILSVFITKLIEALMKMVRNGGVGPIWRKEAPCVFHAVNTPQELGRNVYSEQSLHFVVETLELYCLYLRGPLHTNRRGRYALGSHRWWYGAWRRWDNAGRRSAERSVTLLHQFGDLLRLIITRLLLDFGIPNLFRHLKRELSSYPSLSPVKVLKVVGNYMHKEIQSNVNKKVQLDATVCRHLFTAKSLYMFRTSQHPSSAALKTVTAASGIGHNTGAATLFQRGLVRTCPDQTTLEKSSCTNIMTYTRGSG